VIDYVLDPSTGEVLATGLVNDGETALDEATRRQRHASDEDTGITTGYHPIEFLLWGQDSRDAIGQEGQRPLTDYVSEEHADRRATYLRTASRLLQDDLGDVLAEWRDEPETFRTRFAEGDPREALRDVLTGMAEMSGPELAGERINVAVMTGDQEDEHSCFSDNTMRETQLDALGIQNVYLGRYVRTDGSVVEGPSISELVRARDSALDDRMRAQLQASVDAANAIDLRFDEAILSTAGQQQLGAVVDALLAQAATIGEVAALFDIELASE
jgi:putative iron-regulated protein